jgi:hypothetical protein
MTKNSKKNKLTKSEKAEARKERRRLYLEALNKVGDKPIFSFINHPSQYYCPICKQRFEVSNYLNKVFGKDEKSLWLANMVMHYRHCHITSWNKYWGWNGWRYRQAAHFGDYDTEKAIVNERAKRQIARKCPQYIISYGINKDVYNKLQGTTSETISTVEKIWQKYTA